MSNIEHQKFEPQEPHNTGHSRLTKKILRAGVLAATMAAGQESIAAAPQEIHNPTAQAEKGSFHFFNFCNPSAMKVMLKTGVRFEGSNFLYLAHMKKGIDLSDNGTAIGVEVLAQGDTNLLIKIHKKSKTLGQPDKITEIKISNGYLPTTSEQPKK